MLPAAYQLPAAVMLLVGGVVACFFGYRLFRVVLAIYGFIIGAVLANALFGSGGAVSMLVSAIVGGLIGAVVLIAAYFVGVALAGAGLGALLAHVLWAPMGAEPHAFVIIAFALLGAIGAMVFQRYVIVVSTAFGGSWTMIVGALALAGSRAIMGRIASGDPWRLNPISPAPGEGWIPVVWIALALAGMVVQLQHMKRKG